MNEDTKKDNASPLPEAAQSLINDIESNGDSAPCSQEKMDEMIALLRNISSKQEHRHATAYDTLRGSQWIPQIQFCFALLWRSLHPIRRWLINNKILVIACLSMTCGFLLSRGLGSSSSLMNHQMMSPFDSNSSNIISHSSTSQMTLENSRTDSISSFSTDGVTLYFNTQPGFEKEALPLPQSLYPGGGSVVCILASSNPKDVGELQIALRSLVFLQGDMDLPSPVLIFNEGDLSDEQKESIRSSTKRPIAFPIVDLSTFPPGFDPKEWEFAEALGTGGEGGPEFTVANRKPWGYYQMIRFFVTRIWEHPAIQPFETIMRMDSDSCFKEINSYLPHMAYPDIVYHSQYVGTEPPGGKPFITGLYDFAVEFMKRANRKPKNTMLWKFIEYTWTYEETLPLFRTNAEVCNKSFMIRPDVLQWHRSLTEEEPFGLLRFRWGDAITRFFETAMFATDETALTVRMDGYFHKKGCSWAEVEAALKQHDLLDQ
mmetsp:Transcript_13733/g.19644  ORF Transcript_13733/g.19644 Transcript_13733/m.19644 type:complete len:487 (-) Transcript_13733:75-1535(-)